MSDERITTTFGDSTQSFDAGTDITIGRDPTCDVRVESPHVSRAHAILRTVEDGSWELIDNGSTQGTWVGGRKVDRIRITGSTEVSLGQPGRGATVTLDVATEPAPELGTVPAEPGPNAPPPPTAAVLPPPPGDAPSAGMPPPTVAAAADGNGNGPARPGGELRLDGPVDGTVITDEALLVECGGQSHRFERGREAVIGRDPECDIVSANPTVSRRHASVAHDGRTWVLTDLGSSGGTFVDGRRTGRVPLGGSTAVHLGDPDTGERVVLVASGARQVAMGTQRRRRGRVLAGVAVAAFAVVVLGALVVTRGGSSSASSADDLAQASVRLSTGQGAGSGTIIDAERGLILTNAHVAAPETPGMAVAASEWEQDLGENADEIRIFVSGGKDQSAQPKYLGEVVAADGYLDLAVVKITKLASGAFISDGDLDGLVDVEIGNSDDLATGDAVRIVGYPGVSESDAPQLNQGVVGGPVRDDRLSSNSGMVNVDADINPGNSGGGAFDDEGRLVGVPSLVHFESDTLSKSNRMRPVNFAADLIEDATNETDYSSDYIWPLAEDAAVENLSLEVVDGSDPFTAGCDGRKYSPSVGDPGMSVTMDVRGFGDGPHQDIKVDLVRNGTRKVGSVYTNAEYPFTPGATGCLTVFVPVVESDGSAGELDAAEYDIVVYAGPSYEEMISGTISLEEETTTTTAPGTGGTGGGGGGAPAPGTGAPPALSE